jgi:hypothetical protein
MYKGIGVERLYAYICDNTTMKLLWYAIEAKQIGKQLTK